MLDISGIVYPEGRDAFTAAELRRFAESVNTRLIAVMAASSAARGADCMVVRPSVSGSPLSNGDSSIDFDTTVYATNRGSGGVGIATTSMRPGVYLAGGFLNCTTTGSVSRILTSLRFSEERGPRLVSSITENVRKLNAKSGRGIEQATVCGLFQVTDPGSAFFSVEYSVVSPSGSITVTTASRLWAIRIRGL